MATGNLSSFEESSRQGERGYDDVASSLAASESSSSFAKSTKQDEGLVDNTISVNKNKVV